MTNEEAIKIIEGRNFSCIECIDRSEECCKALDMAIKALSAEKTANKININEHIKVKLTDYGKEIFYHQYDNLNKAFGKEIIKPSYPTVDSDGYTSFQLWCFMNLYGRYIDIGVQNVIEPLEIVFESADNTAEWIIKDGIFGVAYCSKCDYELHTNDTNYCPNCGRRMKGVGE